MANDNPQQPVGLDKPKINPLTDLKTQISAGPLPKTMAGIESKFLAHRSQILLGTLLLGLILVIIFGVTFGGDLAKLFRPKSIVVPELPTVTPTTTVKFTSRFDNLRDQVKTFTGLLPDPAPPAVDDHIDLEQPKR